MAQQPPPFDPNELAKWLVDGVKETVSYRIKQTLNREKLLELIQSKIPTRNQLLHQVLRQAFERSGFGFETLKQGDATFHLIRKRFREVSKESGHSVRRLVLIPGFGDTPGSWIPSFGFSRRELSKRFDEVIILDFPGYLGFLSQSTMVPSMAVLLGVVKTVCEANPPSVLAGHSLGGWLAAKVAQDLHKPIDHLIVIAPSGLTPECERKAFADFIVNNQNVPLDDLIQKVIHDPKKFHHLIREDMKAFYSKPEVREFVESVKPDQFVNPNQDFRAKKVTVIWGENDQFVPAHWLRHWIEHFGGYTDAYVMKETGHLPQIERPMVFSEVFLSAILDRPATEGKGWKKVHSRPHEQELNPRRPESSQKMISS
jgi:pimeloyl-ACP methyl ester carboxylesterase